jgi:hypothetical protein
MSKSTVTLEFLTIIVRLHDVPTEWGEFAPYDDGFVLHQVEAGVYEAKLAKGLDFQPSHQRALAKELIRLKIKKVFLWRHKEGEAPYKLTITAEGVEPRETLKNCAT